MLAKEVSVQLPMLIEDLMDFRVHSQTLEGLKNSLEILSPFPTHLDWSTKSIHAVRESSKSFKAVEAVWKEVIAVKSWELLSRCWSNRVPLVTDR